MAQVLDIELRGKVAWLTLNRPAALNALNTELRAALCAAAARFDADPAVHCLVITGNARAFCAGADIRELADWHYPDNRLRDPFADWDRFAELEIPKIAAVTGVALGGGCELALMCDLIYAAEEARFGQPELKLGLIPGMGGTQRLVKRIGRTRAKEMVLTGETIDAHTAERYGLANRVFTGETLFDEVDRIATHIASLPRDTTRVANSALDRAEEDSLTSGLRYERESYYALWSSPSAQEGMRAFLEKRQANFNS